jgi:hypothetical protein
MANFPKGISAADYVPPANRPYTPPWNSKDACRVICDCGGSYDTDVSSTVGRMRTFIRNDQVPPKVRHERGQQHQKWAKNPNKKKIRQDLIFVCRSVSFCSFPDRNSHKVAVPSFAKIPRRFIVRAVAITQIL